MKTDLRVQYPLWLIGLMLIIIWMSFGSKGWISDLLVTVNVKNAETIEGVMALLSAILFIVFGIALANRIATHNKAYPNRKLSFFQMKPFEYIEDDEGWQYISRSASQKVYSFFSLALPVSLVIHLFFNVPQYGVVINIFLLVIMQFLIYYLEIRKYVREDIE